MRINRPIAAAILMLALAGSAGAQRTTQIGPRIGYDLDREETIVGLQMTTPIGRYVDFYPAFEYYLVDRGTLWTLSMDVKVHPAASSANWLYLGGGMDVTRRAVGTFEDNSSGLNLLAGFEAATGGVRPFGEMRFTLADQTTSRFTFGLNFPLR
jgi:hypothetical protein